MKPDALVSQKRHFSGEILDLEVREYELAAGIKVSREIILHVPAVGIIPVLGSDQYILVQQFRPAAEQMLWEIPAGSIDPEEELETAAKRELAEETGYGCKKIELLFGAFPSPGFLTEKISVFVAHDLYASPQEPDEDEQIQIKTYNQAQILKMIQENKIQDFKTISAFLYYWKFKG